MRPHSPELQGAWTRHASPILSGSGSPPPFPDTMHSLIFGDSRSAAAAWSRGSGVTQTTRSPSPVFGSLTTDTLPRVNGAAAKPAAEDTSEPFRATPISPSPSSNAGKAASDGASTVLMTTG